MAALSLALVLASFWNKDSERIDWSGASRALSTWLAIAAAVAALKLVGFLISFAALTFFIVAVMYRRPLKNAAIVAVVSAAVFYLVFPVALGVRLP
jgi:hypothetical protein